MIPVDRPSPSEQRPQGLCLDRGRDDQAGCARPSPNAASRRTSAPAARKSDTESRILRYDGSEFLHRHMQPITNEWPGGG